MDEGKTDVHDVVMVGAGPSAMAAAVYTTREDIETILYEKAVVGGLAAITDKVDNYPGFPEGIEGMKLASELQAQAQRFGAKFEYGDVSEIRENGTTKTVVVDGKDVEARTVLIATGSEYRKIGVPGEEEFYGRGVHYCATCDGAFYRDKKLAVVGGGNSAVQETIFLTRFADHIDMLVRTDFKASDVLMDELKQYIDSGKVSVHKLTETSEIIGTDGKVTSINITEDGTATSIDIDGVFVFVGLLPNTDFLKNSVIELDPVGHIVTNQKLETAMPGVFASGDVRSGATLQIASAVGEGATAALNIREYIDEQNRNTETTT